MKKMLVMAAFMLSSVCAFAQHEVGSLTIQPKVGLNIANVTDFDPADCRLGLAAGAELEYQISDMFSITGGVLYSMQGYKYDESSVDFTAKMDYINVPILANVYVVKGLAVKLGIQPGFNVNHTLKAKAAGVTVDKDFEDLGLETKTVDFSIPVGVSYEYNNIVLDARYNWGLTKMFDGSDSKNSVFQVTLGYKFAL